MVWRLGSFVALLWVPLLGCGGKSSGSAGDVQPVDDLPAQCRGFADEGGWSLLVRIKNEMQVPIHLGSRQSGCGDSPRFAVVMEGGQALQIGNQCTFSCAALINDLQVGCPLICLSSSSISLMPGESLRLPWGGTFLSNITLPKTCLPEGVLLDQCTQQKRIEPGSFEFTASAGTQLDCSMTGGVPCGSCKPNPDGGCVTNNALIGGDELHAEIALKLDPGYGVGEGGPSGDPLPIELVFR